MLGEKEQLRRFQALVHASPDFIAIAGIDGTVEFLNNAGRVLVGMGTDVDVTRTSLSDYISGQSSLTLEEAVVVRDGYWTGETTLRDWRDDSPIPVMVTSVALRDQLSGAPVGVATILRDLRDMRAASAQATAATAALEQVQALQQALFLHLSDLVLVVDADLALTYASPSARRLLGYAEGSRLGRPLLELVHPEEREVAVRTMRELLRQPGPGRALRVRVLDAAGQVVHFEARSNNLLAEPSIRGVVITARDISDTVEAEQAQVAVAHVLELIAAEAPVRDVLTAVVGWLEGQLPGMRCTVLLTEPGLPHRVLRDGASPSMPDAYRTTVDGLAVGDASSPCSWAVGEGEPVVVADLLADPQWAPMHALARACDVRSCWSYPISSPASGATLGSFALYGQQPGLPDRRAENLVGRANHLVGITVDRHRLLGRLAHQAQHDTLTLLPNRLHLLEQLTAALERSARGAASPVVLFFDLDRLKVVNDSLGHDVGDELLISIARRLRTAVGPGDLVARFGGDEFVVLSTRLEDGAQITGLAERLLEVISEPVELEGRLISPAASIGLVAAAPGQTATAVLRDADIAMYRAKQRGGNGYEVFGEHMRQRAFDRLDLEGQIRQGLEAGQFRVYYQPLVDLQHENRIVGFEALVRWQHPERGLLTPDVFLQLADETGLIVPLGEWVLRTAVETTIGWREQGGGEPLSVAVNVAAKQLESASLLPLVADSVQSLSPWTLGLELTESTLMDNTAAVLRKLDAIAAVGCQLSIDDFGTGFSSLSYLTRLPVHRLKIDRSFVADLHSTSRAASTVASAIISLAEQLKLTTIAEGIETIDQRQRLVQMGCRYGQGYLFSRPVPEHEALALLQAQVH